MENPNTKQYRNIKKEIKQKQKEQISKPQRKEVMRKIGNIDRFCRTNN